MQDTGLILTALALFAGIPLTLWAEAVLRGPRWFRRVATGLLVAWFCVLGLVSLQEWLCEGSSLKGYTSCAVPVLGETLQHFPGLAGVPLVILGYAGAVVIRIGAAILRHLRSRAT
jgi:hypothetical protein